MKLLCTIALVMIALPAAAQEAKPLPPGSYQYDGMRRLYLSGDQKLPSDSFQDDRNRQGLRDFERPTPVTILPPPENPEPPQQDQILPRPAVPPPAEKPAPIIG